MTRWLRGFAYRIDLGINVFLLTGIFIILMAFLSISFQSVKAALASPVKSLQSE
jgi:putative ABC transport system permease protein